MTERTAANSVDPPASQQIWPRSEVDPSKDSELFRAVFGNDMDSETFVSQYLGKRILYMQGDKNRFHTLFSWKELNSILEQHRLEADRLNLFRNGKEIAHDRYFISDGKRDRINPAALTNLIASGASLIFNQIHECAPAVGVLNRVFESVLQARHKANLYASWGTQRGFDLHWDSHDTTILQMAGRKNWKVYTPTRPHPFRNELNCAPKPTEPPAWEGILEEGDVLYMPRGWWHVATPLSEPSLHLTFGGQYAAGTDFLAWAVRRLIGHSEIRRNVPLEASVEKRSEYLQDLQTLVENCDAGRLMEEFLAEERRRIPQRTRLALPSSPEVSLEPIGDDSFFRLAVDGAIALRPDGHASVSFSANDRQWRCAADVGTCLTLLNDGRSHSFKELCDLLPDAKLAVKLTMLLTQLAMGGAVTLAKSPPGGAA